MRGDVLGGGQPCGLAAAQAWGRRPPSAGGGPTKYHRLAFRNFLDEKAQRPMRLTGEVPWRGMVGLEGAVGTSEGKGGNAIFF
jgi:hypothetical protein